MANLTRRGFVGSLSALAAATSLYHRVLPDDGTLKVGDLSRRGPTDVQRVMLKIRRLGAFRVCVRTLAAERHSGPLGRGGERHRDRSVGHCRADRRRAGL